MSAVSLSISAIADIGRRMWGCEMGLGKTRAKIWAMFQHGISTNIDGKVR